MGGDGGTKAVHRSYLRGAGSASTTGDAARKKRTNEAATTTANRTGLHYCALTDRPLDFSNEGANALVVCPFGNIYYKEAAIEALLERKQQQREDKQQKETTAATITTSEPAQHRQLGEHIRGLKDLHAVRFQSIVVAVDNYDTTDPSTSRQRQRVVPVCPVTGRELHGSNKHVVVVYALIPGTDAPFNVVSEAALQQLSEAALFQEYGATRKIRLAPPPDALVEVRNELESERQKIATEKCASMTCSTIGTADSKKRKANRRVARDVKNNNELQEKKQRATDLV